MKASSFLTKEQSAHILSAVKEAEKETSGEIRVHIENSFTGEVLDRAAWIFRKLDMHKTAERNGVLFYLAIESHKFAIIGDAGINSKVPEGFWDEIKSVMEKDFRTGDFAGGLAKGIIMAGKQLKEHFPYQRNDKNELSDEISLGNPDITGSV